MTRRPTSSSSRPAPPSTPRGPPPKERIFVASQWQLMWWRFRKHKLAVLSAIVVIGFYWSCSARTSSRTPTPTRRRPSAR